MENILSLSDVNEKDNGTYECVAQRYTLKNEKLIKVTVYGEYMIDSLNCKETLMAWAYTLKFVNVYFEQKNDIYWCAHKS